jgi:predicted transposase YbfD/YdcC
VLVILAKLAGEQEPRGIAQWVALRQGLLYAALRFERDTVPHPTTYSRILGNAIAAARLQQACTSFLLAAAATTPAVEINLDGKTLRGTIRAGQTQGLHLLAAYLPDASIVLMQTEVGTKEDEIVAAPRLLKSVDLRGEIVTGERLEQRRLTSSAMPAGEVGWPHLEQVFKIEREIEQLSTGKRRSEVSYGITSLSRQEADAERLQGVKRKRWEIENGLHYRRDWTLREDYCRLKTGDAA